MEQERENFVYTSISLVTDVLFNKSQHLSKTDVNCSGIIKYSSQHKSHAFFKPLNPKKKYLFCRKCEMAYSSILKIDPFVFGYLPLSPKIGHLLSQPEVLPSPQWVVLKFPLHSLPWLDLLNYPDKWLDHCQGGLEHLQLLEALVSAEIKVPIKIWTKVKSITMYIFYSIHVVIMVHT